MGVYGILSEDFFFLINPVHELFVCFCVELLSLIFGGLFKNFKKYCWRDSLMDSFEWLFLFTSWEDWSAADDPSPWAIEVSRHRPTSCSCCCWRVAGRIAAAPLRPIRLVASTSTHSGGCHSAHSPHSLRRHPIHNWMTHKLRFR